MIWLVNHYFLPKERVDNLIGAFGNDRTSIVGGFFLNTIFNYRINV